MLPVSCQLLLLYFGNYPLLCSHQPWMTKARSSFPFTSLKHSAVNKARVSLRGSQFRITVVKPKQNKNFFFLSSLSGWFCLVKSCTWFSENDLSQLATKVGRNQFTLFFLRSTSMYYGRECKFCNAAMWQQSKHHRSVKHLVRCSRTLWFVGYELSCDFWFKFIQGQLVFVLVPHCHPLASISCSFLPYVSRNQHLSIF